MQDPDEIFDELRKLRSAELPSFGEIERALRDLKPLADRGPELDRDEVWEKLLRRAGDGQDA
ncbi:MAG: hypothetical protein U0U69_02160 [Acidimicrobiia bacterium]